MTGGPATAALVDDWQRVYRAMQRGRIFDRLALALQRQGAIDSYGESRGQEGAQIGTTIDLRPDDMVFPSYRQPSVALLRGVTTRELLQFYSGVDLCPWDWKGRGFGPVAIPVGSQLAHAAGWAWAARLKRTDNVSVVFFGDGSSSQGEVHEAMNYAAVFDAPVVFVLENNGWAISTSTAKQTRAEGFYLRAQGYGFPGVRVDGNDVSAVRDAASEAIARARAGHGPTLIEAVTYRMGGHTTSDNPRLYRDPSEVTAWEPRDPIAVLREQLADVEGFAEASAAIDAEVETEIERSMDEFLVERGIA